MGRFDFCVDGRRAYRRRSLFSAEGDAFFPSMCSQSILSLYIFSEIEEEKMAKGMELLTRRKLFHLVSRSSSFVTFICLCRSE